MKKQLSTVVVASVMVFGGSSVSAEDIGAGFDLSGNVALGSDYIWRGVSQSQGKGAIQGGVDLTHSSGFYLGTWASNVDFDGAASSEWDYYLGYGFEAGPVAFDLGHLAYTYVDNNSLNFQETYASMSVVGISAGVNYTHSGLNNAGESWSYLWLGYDIELPGEVGLSLVVGEYDYKDEVFTHVSSTGFAKASESRYQNYGITLSKSYKTFDFSVSYTDTNLTDSECGNWAGKADFCDGNVTLMVSKSL